MNQVKINHYIGLKGRKTTGRITSLLKKTLQYWANKNLSNEFAPYTFEVNLEEDNSNFNCELQVWNRFGDYWDKTRQKKSAKGALETCLNSLDMTGQNYTQNPINTHKEKNIYQRYSSEYHQWPN